MCCTPLLLSAALQHCRSLRCMLQFSGWTWRILTACTRHPHHCSQHHTTPHQYTRGGSSRPSILLQYILFLELISTIISLTKFYLQGSTCLERSCQAAAPSPRPSPRPSRRPGTRSQSASTGETSSQFRSISTQTSSSWVLYLSSLALVRAGGDVKCLKNFHSFSQLARMSFAANTDLI